MKVGIFIYEEVEPIDLAVYGVLSMARRILPQIEIFTIAPEAGLVRLSNGLQVVANFGIDAAPQFDVLIITGGAGWKKVAKDLRVLGFISGLGPEIRVLSVCTGAMILAAAGRLDGKKATTKHLVVPPENSPLAEMRERYPLIDARMGSLVDSGGIITGGGVTLCIDTVLYLIGKEFGHAAAKETACILEYSRAWEANSERFPAIID